jgi:hypothetical protein
MQAEDKLYEYLEASGCFKRVVVVLIDANRSFDCGSSGCEPDGTIVLGGYEVYARGRSITETWPVTLYFHTETSEDSQAMLEMFTPGNVLLVESNCWSICDEECTFYLENLASAVRLPDRLAQSYWSILGPC